MRKLTAKSLLKEVQSIKKMAAKQKLYKVKIEGASYLGSKQQILSVAVVPTGRNREIRGLDNISWSKSGRNPSGGKSFESIGKRLAKAGFREKSSKDKPNFINDGVRRSSEWQNSFGDVVVISESLAMRDNSFSVSLSLATELMEDPGSPDAIARLAWDKLKNTKGWELKDYDTVAAYSDVYDFSPLIYAGEPFIRYNWKKNIMSLYFKPTLDSWEDDADWQESYRGIDVDDALINESIPVGNNPLEIQEGWNKLNNLLNKRLSQINWESLYKKEVPSWAWVKELR